MVKTRVVETNVGILGENVTADYDVFCRNMRDKGWLETKEIMSAGIAGGDVLEVGPGPGYLGLEWMKKAPGAHLTGIEISLDMIQIARKNAKEYGFGENSVRYVQGNAMSMPFPDGSFDAVFSNGSLHEWETPERVFAEIHRVLKDGGRFMVSDLRRDISLFVRVFMKAGTEPKHMRSGLESSLNAAYTPHELEDIIGKVNFSSVTVRASAFGLVAAGKK